MTGVTPACRFYGTQLQGNKVPIWISTGVRDTEYPPTSVVAFAEYFSQVLCCSQH